MTCWHHGACRDRCGQPTLQEELTCLVRERPNLTAAQLADILALHSTNVSQMLKQLTDGGDLLRGIGTHGRFVYRVKPGVRRFKRTV